MSSHDTKNPPKADESEWRSEREARHGIAHSR